MIEARDRWTYWALVAGFASLGAAAVFFPDLAAAGLAEAADLPAPRPVMALVTLVALAGVYGGLGWLGLKAVHANDWPGLWAPDVSQRQRLLIPLAWGVALGVLFIVVDALLAPYNGMGRLPHPPFPTSVLASVTAAIGEELLFRLVLVGGGFWVLGNLVSSASGRRGVFWAVVLFSAVAFTASHLPGILYILGDGDPAAASLSPVLLSELFVLNGLLTVVAAELLRRYGFLAAVGVHFWLDIVWHVIGGGLQ